MTKPKIKQLRERAERATPGPWDSDYCGDIWSETVTYKNDEAMCEEPYPITTTRFAGDQPRANAKHIAQCDPQTILKLLDVIEISSLALGEACFCTGEVDFNLNDIKCYSCETLAKINDLIDMGGE